MENRDALLKRLSRRDDIENLIKKYGFDYKHRTQNEYKLMIEMVWNKFKNKDTYRQNNIRIIYESLIEPFCESIERSLEKVTRVNINKQKIYSSIREYLGMNVAMLSDSVVRCCIENYKRTMNVRENIKQEELERKFVEQLQSDEVMFRSIYGNFQFWTYSLFEFLRNNSEYLKEVFTNLDSEYEQIKDELLGDDFKVTDIKLEVGDRHNGRFVIALKTDKMALFYKPRNNNIEKCLKEITQLSMKYSEKVLDLRLPKAYANHEHQWVAENQYISLKFESEEKRYYYRMGEILALYYILDGNDLHFENIISAGEYPVLIDTETLFTNRMMLKVNGENDYIRKNENIYGIVSIKDIGIIPNFIKIGNDSIDISSIRYEAIIEDIERNKKFNIDKSKLHIAGTYISIQEVKENMIAGFEAIYKVFLNNRNEMIDAISRMVADLSVRYLKHPTNDYGKIKKAMMKPVCFFDYEYAFAITARTYGRDREPDKIELCEQEDLMNLNIPRFELKVDQKDIYWNGDKIVENYFCESAWEVVKNKINYLSEDDYNNQVKIIEMMFQSLCGLKLQETSEFIVESSEETMDIAYRKRMIARYQDIINKVISSINRNPISGERFFIGYQLQGEKYQAIMLPNNYYSGMLGLLSVLREDTTGLYINVFKEESERFIGSLADKIQNMGDEVLTGAYDGLAMYIRTLQELYESGCVREDKYSSLMMSIIDKCRLAEKKDKKYDVLNGNAGLLLMLDALVKRDIPEDIKAAARTVMKECIATMCSNICKRKEECFFPVDGMPEVFFTGYGHGSAGIITALYKAMKTTGSINEELIAVLLNTERKYFDKEQGIWYKDNRRKSSSWGWCHGIPGILLGRIELWKAGYRDEKIYDEINSLVSLSLQKGVGHNTTFCHGDIAIISILNHAFTVLPVDDRFYEINGYKSDFIKKVLLSEKNLYVRGTETVGMMDGLLGIAYFLNCEIRNTSAINVLNTEFVEELHERARRCAG